jgi:hypothetical protein
MKYDRLIIMSGELGEMWDNVLEVYFTHILGICLEGVRKHMKNPISIAYS